MTSSSAIRDFFHRIARAGVVDGDSDEERLRKETLTMVVLIIVPLSTVWTITYLALGEWQIAIFPLAYQVLAAASLLLFIRNKRYMLFCFTQLALILLLPMGMHVSFGGFAASSGVMLWSFVAPLGALLCQGTRYAVPWFVAFASAVALAAVVDPFLVNYAVDLPRWVQIVFFALNMMAVTFTAFLLLQYFVRGRDQARAELDAKHLQLLHEQERSENLLLNVLPAPIAERLKGGETRIADRIPDATVLFADLAGFTALSSQLSPEEVVGVLNRLFSAFDRLADEHGLEKIKTIGDSYMLVGGLPEPRADHVEAVADMALRMHPVMRECSHNLDHPLSLRIGIDTGPVVAGVIGQNKFAYDTWGDTVNTANRMASYGAPGSIQVTGNVVRKLYDRYLFQSRGTMDIKGKGAMQVYVLRARLDESGYMPDTRSPLDGAEQQSTPSMSPPEPRPA